MAFILVLHGPNMALKGVADINRSLEARAFELGARVSFVQSNAESALVDALHDHRLTADAIIVNPGVLAPVAWVLKEALELIAKPAVEVLLSPLAEGRGPSALQPIVVQQVHDRGSEGYAVALEALIKRLPPELLIKREDDHEDDAEVAPSPRGKTIGRRAPPPVANAPQGKTIGPKNADNTSANAPAAAAPTKLTRAQVRDRLKARLGGSLSADALASWARTEWSSLQRGGACEDGHRETLDAVLLTLMGGARVSDHILLAQLAKLES